MLVQASRLYYELGETQNAVADRLGVTRPQISRLLKRARAEGIVEIRIVDRDTAESPAADELQRRFGLAEVHLAPTLAGPEDLTRRIVGRLAAQVLRDNIRDGSIVGIGDGASVAAIADALDEDATPVSATVVPLAGGYWSTGPDRDPFRRIADAFRAQPHGLMAPGLLDDAATKRALEAHAGVRTMFDLWKRLDIALFGIGGRAWGAATLGEDVAGELDEARAVGRDPHRPVRPRGAVRLPGPARSRAGVRCARSLKDVPVAIGVGSGETQGRADPRRASIGRGIDARHGCGHGRGHRRGRARDDAAPTSGDPRDRPRHDRGQGRTRRSRRAAPGDGSGRLRPRRRRAARAGRNRTRAPGGRRSSSPCARCARRTPSTSSAIGVDGHGPTLAAVDDRGEATRPAITFLDTRATAEADELAAVTGLRGWALGPLPAALWVERHEPDVGRSDPLVPDHLGVARVPADRRRGRAARARPGGPGSRRPSRRDRACHAERRPEPAAHRVRSSGALTPDRGRRARAAARHPGRGRHERRLRELPRGGSRSSPATPTTRAARRVASACTGTSRSRWPGAFVTPAPLEGLYSVGAAMAATGRALDWFRDGVVGWRHHHGTSARGGRRRRRPAPTALVFLPYLAGERSPIWDPDATGVFAGLTLVHGRGHLARAILEASALAIRHVAEPMLAAGVTRDRDARVRRPGAQRDAGTRSRPTSPGSPVLVPAVLETAVLGSAILGAVGDRRQLGHPARPSTR